MTRPFETDPPACRHAEAALLGAVLLAPQQASELLHGLTPEHVTHPRHHAVLEALQSLQAGRVLPEPIAVLERLQQAARTRTTGVWADRDPAVVLADLMDTVSTPAAAPYWRELVLEYAERRRLITTAIRLDQAAREASPEQLAAVVQATGRQLTRTSVRHDHDVVEIGSREAA